MKRNLLPAALCLICALLLIGCGSTAPAAAPGPAVSASPVETEAPAPAASPAPAAETPEPSTEPEPSAEPAARLPDADLVRDTATAPSPSEALFELAKSYVDKPLSELQAEIEKELFAERREFNSTDDIEQYVDQIFAFLKQQESVYRQLLASDAPMAFMDQLESGMTQRVLSIMHEKEIDDRNVEFELLILASGTFAIVRKYYRNEVSVTLDDIRAYLSNKLRVLFEQYVK